MNQATIVTILMGFLAIGVSSCANDLVTGLDAPGPVDDLEVLSVSLTSVTLGWTQVHDGAGQPARYLLRYGSPTIDWDAAVGTDEVVEGTAIGEPATITFDGLPEETAFQFQLRPFRGMTASEPVAAGPRSNVVSASTSATPDFLSPGTASANAGNGNVSLLASAPSGGIPPYAYQWYRSTSSGFTPSGGNAIAGLTSRSETDTDVTNGNTYYYRLVATDDAGASVTYNEVNATPSESAGAPFFQDGFEAGDLSHSENGFTWAGEGSHVFVSPDRARSGSNSLRFHYTGSSSPEERFNLGSQYTEIWVEWYVWIPADWQHPGGSPSNDKFFFLWGGDYNHEGAPKAGMEFLADANTGPESNLRIMYDPAGNAATRTVPDGDIVNWIGGNGVMVRGAWNQMRVHINIGTGSTTQTDGHATGDGIYEVWSNSSLIYRNTNIGFMPEPSATYPYWDVGYFFGSSNSDPVDVSFYIDDVSFYNSDPGW